MKNIFLLLLLLSIKLSFSQTIDVQHYEINLKVPNSYNKYIEGNTKLDVKFTQDNISSIDLMLLALEIDSIKQSGNLLTYSYNDTLINIELESSYQANDQIDFTIYYHGTGHTDDDGWGGYISSLGYAFNLGVSMSADPHNYGRAWYPCVDNFTDKATYNFNITCQEQRTAVCGGTLTDEINNGDGMKTFSWELSRETPTYLTSIAVGNYEVYRDTFDLLLGDIPLVIYARLSEIDNVAGSFVNLEEIIKTYEAKFGAYRWSRIGYVGVPFNGGAMEHAENIAYPNSSINGNTASETLYAHELAHAWFGNLVTCSTAGDMWINEGWASYCEAIFTEELYGKEAFKTYNRDRHKDNLYKLHINEGGYHALYGIPTDLTYSSHVYQKGADVAHSLRGHLGDEVFFDVMTQFLEHYKFQSVDSYQFRDFLTANTAYDLTGFFDAWVFDGGWLHFAVDSFTVSPNGNLYDIEVFMRQKLKGKTSFGMDNRVPIQFLSSNFDRIDTTISFSGQSGSQIFTIPFNPYMVICDLEEQISDATSDSYEVIKTTGEYALSQTYFKTNVSEISDSVLLRVEHNWVAPDPMQTEIRGLQIHTERYWKVDGIFNSSFEANGQFYYSKSSSLYLDHDFVTTHTDSIVMLYRPNSGEDWQIIEHSKEGSNTSGYMVVEHLQRGEYAFAIWDHSVINIKPIDKKSSLLIFPNPAEDKLSIEYETQTGVLPNNLVIYDIKGKEIQTQKILENKTVLELNISQLSSGTYLLVIKQDNTKLNSTKFVVL